MNNTGNFIATKDKQTATELMKMGFELVQQDADAGSFVFLNCPTKMSNAIDFKKIIYTNKLFV